MKQDKVLQVCYEDQTVGTLAMTGYDGRPQSGISVQ